MTVYATRTDAITGEIIEPIEARGTALAAEFNIDAIADDVLTTTGEGTTEFAWALREDISVDDFWASVERHEIIKFTVVFHDYGEATYDGKTYETATIYGYNDQEVATFGWTTDQAEEFTPRIYSAAAREAGWNLTYITRTGAIATRI